MGAIRRVSFRECQGEAERCKAVCRKPSGIYGQCAGTGTGTAERPGCFRD